MILTYNKYWPAQNMVTLADSLACSVSPAPKAFPTLTLPPILTPMGNYEQKHHINMLLYCSQLFHFTLWELMDLIHERTHNICNICQLVYNGLSSKFHLAYETCRWQIAARLQGDFRSHECFRNLWHYLPENFQLHTSTIQHTALPCQGWPGGWMSPSPADTP